MVEVPQICTTFPERERDLLRSPLYLSISKCYEQELHCDVMAGSICKSSSSLFYVYKNLNASQRLVVLQKKKNFLKKQDKETQPYSGIMQLISTRIFDIWRWRLYYALHILMFQRILLWIHELLEFSQVQKVVTVLCCNSNNSFDLKHYACKHGWWWW